MEYRYLVGFIIILIVIISCNGVSGEIIQPEKNISTVQDLVYFVDEAVVYSQRAGKDSALTTFADPNGSFTRGDAYIWAYDFSGINLAHPFHPEYTGNNKLSLTDPDGLHMIQLMQDTALNGSGFVSYKYENPLTGKTESKLAYVKRVDDSWWLGSGIYGEKISIPDTIPEAVRTSLQSTVDDAAIFAEKVGKVKAIDEFNNQSGSFTTNDSYIFAFDLNGTTLAHPFHPDKIGTNESTLIDVNGISIGGEKLMVAKEGGGFWYYVFDNPDLGNQPEFKASYIKTINNSWVIGTGRYLSDIPVNFSTENKENLITSVHDAVSFVNEHGKNAAIMEFNNPNGTFSNPEMFIFVFDLNGTLLANPYLPGLVGENRLNDQDPYGKYPVKQLIANAEHGGGYTYYFFSDPGSDYDIKLKLGYTELAGKDMVIGSGIFSRT